MKSIDGHWTLKTQALYVHCTYMPNDSSVLCGRFSYAFLWSSSSLPFSRLACARDSNRWGQK